MIKNIYTIQRNSEETEKYKEKNKSYVIPFPRDEQSFLIFWSTSF